jgi:hypothetical protein
VNTLAAGGQAATRWRRGCTRRGGAAAPRTGARFSKDRLLGLLGLLADARGAGAEPVSMAAAAGSGPLDPEGYTTN